MHTGGALSRHFALGVMQSTPGLARQVGGCAEKGFRKYISSRKLSHRSARVLPMLTHGHVFFAKIAGKKPATLVVSDAAPAAAPLIHPLTCFFVPCHSIDFLFAQQSTLLAADDGECNGRIDFSLLERFRTEISFTVRYCQKLLLKLKLCSLIFRALLAQNVLSVNFKFELLLFKNAVFNSVL